MKLPLAERIYQAYANAVVYDVKLKKLHLIQNLRKPGLRMQIVVKPEPQSMIISVFSQSSLDQIIRKRRSAFKLAISLPDQKWLQIVWRKPIRFFWKGMGYIIVSIVLLCAFTFLLYWFTLQLAIPLQSLATALKRFGRDMHAPPLPLHGSDDMQKVAQAFNSMQSRIRRLVHDRDQMLAAISHDLRTPITRLQLRVEYIKNKQQYDKALNDLKDIESMIDSLLAFSRDYHSEELSQSFDFNALLQTISDEQQDLGNKVNYHSTAERIIWKGRMLAMKRAFTNIIENAIKYAEHADIKLLQTANSISIVIDDDGPGIPTELLVKVFEPFFRIDKARSPQKSGTGLGLAVTRNIIRSAGGDINLQNRQPHGLRVTISLPLVH